MLYHLLLPFNEEIAGLGLIRFITFRTAAASLSALALSLFLGPWFIRRLRDFKAGQVVRSDGPASHKPKAGTPTMGGLLILTSVFVPTLLWANLTNAYVWVAVVSTALFGVIGFVDDYLKVTRHSHYGLYARYKFSAQVVVALGVGIALVLMSKTGSPGYSTELVPPFFKWLHPDLGWFYLIPAVFLLVGFSNAVNLTDGLDGLAISTFAVSAATFTAMTYVTGHRVFADYLLIPHSNYVGELTVFCGSLVGASLGFLWWNAHPADVFMGDVGSLALGGAIATIALLIKQEFLLPIICGVFVMEALSVIIQVASFKLTGKRVFRMSPIHHHFELSGWAEPKIITRFLILQIIFSLFSLTTLKLR
jgi:phospho-N-acetylmuramoyl-pentapeptide-transferase